MSELAIHTLLVEIRARDIDREVYQDPEVIATSYHLKEFLITQRMIWKQ